jgi:predicted nucleic acid-binding protein
VLRIYQWVAALLLHTLRQAGHWVVLQGDTKGCRDLRDNMFLEAAVRGNARYLVSRDDDLKRDLELVAQMGRSRYSGGICPAVSGHPQWQR